ncbi:MAG: glycosyltransferase [Candidatus Omnitrophota bacterium]
MEKISVIIPAYNSAKYLAEALDSVSAQTYPVFETIVVDDGSTDNTADIIKKYPVVCVSQKNKGPAAARNAGLKIAKGDYIAFLDSDDMWSSDKTEKQMRLFNDPSCVMVYSDMSHSKDGVLIYKSYLKEKRYGYVGSGRVYEDLLKENFIFTPTVIVKKDVFRKVGYFDENYKVCEDYKMWLGIARANSIGFLDEPLVMRRRHGGNITGDKFLYISSGIKLFNELLESGNACTKRVVVSELNKRFFDMGYYYWSEKDMGMARENFLKAMRYPKNCVKSFLYVIASFLPLSILDTARGLKKCL